MGALDRPMAQDSAQGVIDLSGWVLFDGLPADRVEAYIGDEPAIALRRGEPRPDVAGNVGGQFPAAIASGFTAIVPVVDRWRGQTVEVVVRAFSQQRDVWTSPTARVAVQARQQPVGQLDELTTNHLWAALEQRPHEPDGKLRVCVFTHSLNLGGGELYLQELLLRLHRDYPVELLVVSPLDGPLKKALRQAGIAVHISAHYLVDAGHYLGRVSELATVIRSWAADVVLVNTLGVFAAVDAAVESDVPVVWAIHESFELGLFSYLNWGEHGLHPDVERRWRRCLTTAHTVFEADATLKMFADEVPALQGRRIQYGIDVGEIARYRLDHDRDQLRAELGFGPQHTVLLCMGVYQERKSQLALVLAFAQLADLFPDARLVLVGDHPSPYSAAVRDAVVGLGLSHQVQLIPIQPDTYRWYHVADVMVSASDTESLPRSVLEAMAFGVPTMAADVFGLSEVIHDGVNGWLCRPRSGNALTVGIRRALECSSEDRRQIADACLADTTVYDGKHYPAAYFELMKSLVATHQSHDNARD
jgi:D-inositol-3-phosphate glycosyltransferase